MGEAGRSGSGESPVGTWVTQALMRIQDPRARLNSTARRLLAAAENVIVEKGFDNLTVSNIRQECGENASSIKYHFGNKAGLVNTVVDAALYDGLVKLAQATQKETAEGANGSRGSVARDMGILNQPSRQVRILLEIFPRALRSPVLRRRLRDYYSAFYELHLEQLRAAAAVDSERAESLRGLAMLLAIVGDGLAMEATLKPDYFDMDLALRTLDVLVEYGLATFTRTPG